MRMNCLNLKKIFLSFDRHLDGFINLEDLKSILIQFTIPMSDQLFTQLMERYIHILFISSVRQPIEGSGYGVKTPLSTIFQIYRCSQFILVEETRENHRSVSSHWQTLSSSVVSSTPRHHSAIFCSAIV
jgi:hypothetical protein